MAGDDGSAPSPAVSKTAALLLCKTPIKWLGLTDLHCRLTASETDVMTTILNPKKVWLVGVVTLHLRRSLTDYRHSLICLPTNENGSGSWYCPTVF